MTAHGATDGIRIRTHDLHPSEPAVRATVEEYPPSRTAPEVRPGDFLLSRAHGRRHWVIRWGQGLRIDDPKLRIYRGYTHAALVVSAEGDLIEAVGTGVRERTLADYADEFYQLVRIDAAEIDRRQVATVARAMLVKRARYNWLATVCVTLWAFTGSKLVFHIDGAYTCSGLVARSLLAMGAMFEADWAKVTPAQLAIYFAAPPPPLEPARARRWWRRSAGSR